MTPTVDHPFAATDLPEMGLTRAALAQLVAQGVVRRVFTGVYAPTSLPDTPETRSQCAALVLPKHVVMCDRTAAWIHGVNCFELTDDSVPAELEVVSLRGHAQSRRPGVYGGRRDLRPEDVMEIGGVKVTTPLRTAVDLACLRGDFMAFAVLEAFRRLHGIESEDYLRYLKRRFRGRRGVVQARRLAVLAGKDSESMGESFTLYALLVEGRPRPEQQVWVEVTGWGPCRLDFAYPRLKILIEYDGEEFHGPEQAAHDRERRAALARMGWKVIVVRKHQLARDMRQVWIAELDEALAERRQDQRRKYPRGSREWQPF